MSFEGEKLNITRSFFDDIYLPYDIFYININFCITSINALKTEITKDYNVGRFDKTL